MSTTRDDIIAGLRQVKRPITSHDLALHIGRPSYTVDSILSKQFNYGIISRRLGTGRGKRFEYFIEEGKS